MAAAWSNTSTLFPFTPKLILGPGKNCALLSLSLLFFFKTKFILKNIIEMIILNLFCVE